MSFWHSASLRKRLTRRMVVLQAVVLLAFTVVIAFPLVKMATDEQGLDDRVISEIADSIQRQDDGSLALEPNAALSKVAAEFPAFWFYATDASGETVHMGEIPERFQPMISYITHLNSANIADTGDPSAPTAIMRRHLSEAGQVWVVTAGGPKFNFRSLGIIVFNPFFLGLLGLLTLVSMMAIPWIITRQLRGLDVVAAQADTIDVDQRGVRLSPANVPAEMRSLVVAVNSALQRLDEGMERRQRFLADAAHELRTPIAILHTRIELLPAGEDRSRLLLDVARLANLANQLLDLQRIDNYQPNFELLDLVELAAQVTSDMAPLAIAAGDEVAFDSEADRVLVRGDAMALSRALTNLIQNAIAHGGASTEIKVGVGRNGSIRVSDTGPGVPEEHRQIIFEPFHRIYPLDQGAGLGLNLVQDIVSRHHGKVTIGDAPTGGALFEITLPLAEA